MPWFPNCYSIVQLPSVSYYAIMHTPSFNYLYKQPSIEQIQIHTNYLVKDITALRITMKALNERSRCMEATMTERDRQLEERTCQMEAALIRISNTLGESPKGSGPSTSSM